jgi:hypothetical protein
MHQQLAETMLDRMLEDPDGPETLALAHAGLRDARWGQDFIDAIGQDARTRAARWPMEQMAPRTGVLDSGDEEGLVNPDPLVDVAAE